MKDFVEWRKHHFLLFGVVSATLAVGAAVAVALIFVRGEHLVSLLGGIRTILYGTASTGCGALLGFVITITTLTDAVVQNPQWAEFRKSKAYAELQDIYFATIRWLGVSTLVFLVFLIADTDAHPQLWCEVISIWLICVLTTHMWRSINALELLLRTNSFKMKRAAN